MSPQVDPMMVKVHNQLQGFRVVCVLTVGAQVDGQPVMQRLRHGALFSGELASA